MNKKQMMIAAEAVVVVGVGGIAYALSGPTLELKNDKVNVEYGTTYTPKLKDIVKDYKDFNKDDLEIINKIPNEKDKTYPAVGKYTITVKYKKKALKQSVIVKDTKAPEVVLPSDIEILQGTDLNTFDFKSLMNVSDLSETSIDVDTSKIDMNTPGQYDINVTVKDKYNNETKKTGKVSVIAKPVISSNEEIVHETVKNNDGTTSVKTKVQKKLSSNTNSSSNTNNSNSSGSSNSSSGSSSGNHTGSMTYEDDPKYHWEGDHSYGDGAEINGEDFDKLTGGDWKNWNY
ncbi:immunoglobulin-like domain-containing protein [uncultured Catenibacterium sp.]|uniref:immunoglobulin-like domain-containing protein n=1 Tax=uncultured Catenibacterium sp. TaxID=286142 RepID=UPI0025CFFA9A|nr:immunoglobulin-like domain-containing protein [uncultured Catenibacterium sp.]